MTDRVRTLTVLLDDDYRVDDIDQIMSALRMVKGVQDVTSERIVGMEDWMARGVIGAKMEKAMWEAFEKVRDGKA